MPNVPRVFSKSKNEGRRNIKKYLMSSKYRSNRGTGPLIPEDQVIIEN